MATTTPNYGWPVPTSTDLVKDGATAIEALGDAIDSTLFAQAPGLVKLSTTNFSAVSSQAVTFASSTYKNYKIIMRWTQTAGAGVTCRVRTSTTDYTGAEYNYGTFLVRSAGTTSGAANNSQNQTSINIYGATVGYDSGVNVINQLEMLVSNIYEATSTSFLFNLTTADTSANTVHYVGSARVRESSSRDGLNFILASGSMTGTLQIYGVSE